jgi:exopolyphosphatase / guanosine-5'-triphosphate,3'-diphosphate pyrophosphatase
MNIASIDIGSNSVILLIAELNEPHKRFVPIKNSYATPRTSKDLARNLELDPAAINRLKDVLKDFLAICKDYNVSLILAGATQSFRKAKNGQKVVEEIQNELGIEIKILSGTEEGLLTFYGATSIIEHYSGYMIDIGGGSTEIILSENGKISFSHSFNFGAVNLCEMLNTIPPLDRTTAIAIKKYVRETIQNTAPIPVKFCPTIAVAGTPTTLACMHLAIKDFDENKIEGYELMRQDISFLSQKMAHLTPAEILYTYGTVVAGREDVILTGAVILITLMEILDLESIFISTRGLRHGIIYNYLNGIL